MQDEIKLTIGPEEAPMIVVRFNLRNALYWRITFIVVLATLIFVAWLR